MDIINENISTSPQHRYRKNIIEQLIKWPHIKNNIYICKNQFSPH